MTYGVLEGEVGTERDEGGVAVEGAEVIGEVELMRAEAAGGCVPPEPLEPAVYQQLLTLPALLVQQYKY